MREANRCRICALVLAAALCPSAQAQTAPQAPGGDVTAEAGDDDDITQPVRTLDLRYHVEDDTASAHGDRQSLIFRRNFKAEFDPGWTLGLRADLPVTFSNEVTAGNPDGAYQTGMGRPLALGYLAHTLDERQAWGAGAEIIAPAASGSAFGNGNWDILPIAGYRYRIPEIGPGSFFLAQFRYSTTFAQSFSATPTSNLQFSLELKIVLPDKWFVVLFPSTDIRYNFGAKVNGQAGPLFLPFDGEIGRTISDRMVASLEMSAPVVDDYPVYHFKIELRLSYQLGA
jgi:hypothetical protein